MIHHEKFEEHLNCLRGLIDLARCADSKREFQQYITELLLVMWSEEELGGTKYD